MKWNEVAKVVENDFGMQVDWEERFFVCPECQDVVFECDFNKSSVLALGYCPICGTALTEECEYENFYEHEDEEYDEDEMMERMNMKNNYYIELCGCDDTTPFVMELDENEVNLLQTVAQKSREVSSYACMPRMFVKPLDECDDYELSSVGIRTGDMNDEFVRD